MRIVDDAPWVDLELRPTYTGPDKDFVALTPLHEAAPRPANARKREGLADFGAGGQRWQALMREARQVSEEREAANAKFATDQRRASLVAAVDEAQVRLTVVQKQLARASRDASTTGIELAIAQAQHDLTVAQDEYLAFAGKAQP